MATDLRIDASASPEGGPLLTVTGEVDMHTAPQFHQTLTHAATSYPRLSAGVAALFDAARLTQLELILGPGCLVTPVIKVSQLDQVATISARP